MDASFLSPVVWCILITETVERFSYYGFRAILVLYFVSSLKYTEETAIALYAYTTCVAYSSPILGSILADGVLGRFKTILWFGWMYCLGLLILTIGAFQGNLQQGRILSFLGLFLTCLGTGGIKPCVSAFGADQVAALEQQDKSLSEKTVHRRTEEEEGDNVRAFFASFYFCINLGALSSIFSIPLVRAHFGFGAAFLLPTIMVSIAMLAFLSKRKEYVHHLPDGTSLSTTFRLSFWLIRQDLANKISWAAPTRFPLAASNSNDDEGAIQQQLSDAKQAVKVLPILALLPMFWMLYDQQASVWTLQATRMNLHGLLQPEQMAIINPVEILIFIPLFDRIIYPFWEQRRGSKVTHLLRMRWGMFLAAVSFATSGILESRMAASPDGTISIFWQLPQLTVLAVAEIFVSVTGLEFAYATSPVRLKAFLMGVYLLTTAIGNFFGGVLYSSVFQDLERATIMHVCALLMLGNLGLFHAIARGWEAPSMKDDDSQLGSSSEEGLEMHSTLRSSEGQRSFLREQVELMGTDRELL